MLIREGSKEWIAKEIKEIGDMNFRFIAKSEPSRYAIRLANNMQQCAPEHAVSGDQVVLQLDTQAAWDYVKYCTPENSLVIVKHKGFTGKTALKEHWYGTNYNVRSLDGDAQVQRWRDALEGKSEWEGQLFLPKENPFFPTDFDIRSGIADGSTQEADESSLTVAQRVKKAMVSAQPLLVEQRATKDETVVAAAEGALKEGMVELAIKESTEAAADDNAGEAEGEG